jgi:hypothetical protein
LSESGVKLFPNNPKTPDGQIIPTVSGQLPPQPNVPVYGIINAGPMVKIAMLIPTNINVDVRWSFAFQQLLGQLPPGSTYMADYRYGLGETREALVTQALATVPDLTHVLFVDSDVLCMIPNAIQLLLSNNKPICSGVYFNSLMTGAAAWRGIPNTDPNTKDQLPVIEQPIPIAGQPQGVHEVDKVGFGFVLIQKQLFEELEKKNVPRPWFYYTVDGGARKMQSEDFYFTDKVRDYLGIKPFCDTRVQCGHIKSVVIMPDGSIQVPPHQGQQPIAQK